MTYHTNSSCNAAIVHITVVFNQDLFCCQHTMWLAGVARKWWRFFEPGILWHYALKVAANVFCGQATQVPNLCSIYSMFSHLRNWAICHSKKVGNLFLPKIEDPPRQQKLIDWWKNTELARNTAVPKFECRAFHQNLDRVLFWTTCGERWLQRQGWWQQQQRWRSWWWLEEPRQAFKGASDGSSVIICQEKAASSAVQCNTVQCNTVQCNNVKCNTAQCNTVKCNTAQSNTVKCIHGAM